MKITTNDDSRDLAIRITEALISKSLIDVDTFNYNFDVQDEIQAEINKNFNIITPK